MLNLTLNLNLMLSNKEAPMKHNSVRYINSSQCHVQFFYILLPSTHPCVHVQACLHAYIKLKGHQLSLQLCITLLQRVAQRDTANYHIYMVL